MASTKITALAEQTAGTLHDDDLFVDVDVSDASMAPTGTDKKSKWSSIKSTLKTYFDTLYSPPSPTTTQGDMIVRGASADQRLAIGNELGVLTVKDGLVAWSTPTEVYSTRSLSGFTSGTGASATNDPDRSSLGLAGALVVGTGTATGRGGLRFTSTNTANPVAAGQTIPSLYTLMTTRATVRLPTLSDGVDDWSAHFGQVVHTNTNGAVTDGVYFLVSGSTLVCRSTAASANTSTNWGTTLAANTNYDLVIVWTVGTNAKFYVNGTLIATHTTNLPTAALATDVRILQTAGTNNRTLQLTGFMSRFYNT